MFLLKSKRSPNYQIIYYRNGKKTSKSTGTTKKSEALKFLSEFKKHLNKKEEIPEVKLSKFLNQYKEYMSRGHSPRYLRSIDLSFRMLIDFCGDKYLSEITPALAEDFVSITFKRSKHAAKLYNRSLKAAFNRAIYNWNYIDKNPFIRIKIPRIPQSLPIFLSEDEFKEILSCTERELFKGIFTVAFYTGMRLSEIVNMTWENISQHDKIITVKNTEKFTTKSKKERIIPMSDKVYEAFQNRLPKKTSETDYIFYRIFRVRLRTDYVSKYFKKAVKKAGLNSKIHFHTLRHSFASNLVRKGVPIMVVKELMGHADISTTQIYSHIRTDDLSKAIKAFDKERQ